MKRFWSALLLVAAAASCCREQPEALYKQGREALQRGEMKDAERIAQKGERCFAAQPYWRELFAILEPESVVRTDSARALRVSRGGALRPQDPPRRASHPCAPPGPQRSAAESPAVDDVRAFRAEPRGRGRTLRVCRCTRGTSRFSATSRDRDEAHPAGHV